MKRIVRSVPRICLVVCLAAAISRADGPASSQSAEQDIAAVKRATVTATIELDGYFEPVDALEVRIRPESYQGELKVKSAAKLGATVKQGDVILEIDSAELSRQLAEARNSLLTANTNLAKAESDDCLGQQGDALAIQVAQNDLANAQASLKWFEAVDGKQLLTQAALGVRAADNNVQDQSDELDQLKKMYKTEDLTSATADIVVKRAVRALEIGKIQQGMAESREGKIKEFDYATSRQRLVFAIDQQKQQLAQLTAQQESQAVLRKTAVTAARLAADNAQRKVSELQADLQRFTVTAPAAGTVYYGRLEHGTWSNADARLLEAGEKITAGQVVMTLIHPGKLDVVVQLPEAKWSWVQPGAPARIIPVALPEATCAGKCAEIAPCGDSREAGQAFELHLALASVDARLVPGMKTFVRIDAGEQKDALVVPVTAVSKGRVKVHQDGNDFWRDVVVGKSDDQWIEIRSGLSEGEQVLSKAGK